MLIRYNLMELFRIFLIDPPTTALPGWKMGRDGKTSGSSMSLVTGVAVGTVIFVIIVLLVLGYLWKKQLLIANGSKRNR